jgi:phospholipase A1
MSVQPVLRLGLALAALGANAASADIRACARIAEDAPRLACYDALALRETPPARATTGSDAERIGAAAGDARGNATSARNANGIDAAPGDDPATDAAAHFATAWELDPALRRGTFRLVRHRPLYALAHATDRVNGDPRSPTRPTAPGTAIDLQNGDAKLQVSFKTKLVEDVAGTGADLWFGYTQQSFWQAANSRFSSPFRESNYEPEAILVRPMPFAVGPVRGAYAALALDHQSNGQGGALSRSWNRLVGDIAVTSGPFTLQVRPWLRIDTSTGADDDNPDILDYVGRGELVAAYRAGRHVVTLRGRHSLRTGERAHGSAQLDWANRLAGALNAHVQLFTGFGESLIDYNHRQTAVGVGVSFLD